MPPRAFLRLLLALALALSFLSIAPRARAQAWQLTASHRVADMAVGGGRIVTVGGVQGGIRSSADGIAWTKLADTTARTVCYGNGQFWIVTEANEVLKTDGLSSPVHVADDLKAVDLAYGHGRLVAMCMGDQNGIHFSNNGGLAWERALCPVEFDSEAARIHFAAGRFVATGNYNLMTSADGMLWEAPVQNNGSSSWKPFCITHDDSGFVVMDLRRNFSNDGYYIWRSADGINWEVGQTRIEYAPSDIHFVNGRYYGVYGYLTFSSADGVDWTTESSGTLLNFDRISSLSGMLLAGGSQVIRKSTAAPGNLPPQPLALHPAVELRFMGVDSVSYNIEVSTDLEDWSAIEYGITGHGGMIRRFYSTENQPQRYFRVVTP